MTQEQYPYDLGSHRRQITTRSELCQTWFDRGLVWSYAFNHEEAARCFESAIAADPNCGMAYWGLAYAIGPNYNKTWRCFDDKDLETVISRGYRAVNQAQANASDITPVEKALIKAIRFRYPKPKGYPCGQCYAWNQQFADAMEAVYIEFPDDLDVITIFVDALMNLKPWKLWGLRSGKPTEGARTLEIKAIMDKALESDGALRHPGLLHMYIHLMEMSPYPESALPVADHLRGLVPDGGHLNHMPTHLDVLCGRYEDAIASNSDAIIADEKFLANAGPLNFYTLYRAHDYHFRVYAAMFAGKSQVAFDTVARLEASIPKGLLEVESPPMADWLEAFLTMRAHVCIRFGRWEEIIHLDVPQDQKLYSMTTAILRYSKGVAFAAMGRLKEAEEQCQLFHEAAKEVQSSRTLFNNTCQDILAIAEAMLYGEIEYRRANYEAAYEYLRKSIFLEDSLPYDEPWGWMQPTRHAYGALLLEQGHAEAALEVYKDDLGMNDTLPRALTHQNNVWALHGVHECLLKLGRLPEAAEIEGRLLTAVAIADVPITSSCFCRLQTADIPRERPSCDSKCENNA
ncbi:Fc.00g057170.m01.CDS01 [Cosmosporella sp. VM-42]